MHSTRWGWYHDRGLTTHRSHCPGGSRAAALTICWFAGVSTGRMGGATVSVRLFCLYVGHMWRRRHAHVENAYAANSATGTARPRHELLRVFVYGRRPPGGTVGGISSRFLWATAGHNDLCRLHGLVGTDHGRNEPSLG